MQLECKCCGQTFRVKPYATRGGRAKFCSRGCADKSHPARSPLEERFWRNVDKSGECWVWTGAHLPRGYGHVWANGRRVYTHRLAWELANGPIPAGMAVLHHCDNPPCVRAEHLFIGTLADNAADAKAKERTARGERHYSHRRPDLRTVGERNSMAKLTEAQVLEIKARYTGKRGQVRLLAAEYGVWDTAISRILHGKRWKYLADQAQPA